MDKEIKVFNHEQFGEIRVCSCDGKEWFCLSDVCRALEINNPRDVKKRLQQRGVDTIDTPTYNQYGTMVMQPMTYIDEPNLYRCIFQSRKAEAEQFQNWVFEVVLPQIRKTGGFVPVTKEDDEKSVLVRALKIVMKTVNQQNEDLALQNERISELAPKAEYADEVLRSEDCVTMTQIAKHFGLSAVKVNNMLHEIGVQFKLGGQWHLYEQFAKLGLTRERTAPYFDSEGNPRTAVTTVWTERGKRFVSELIRNDYDVKIAIQLINQ